MSYERKIEARITGTSRDNDDGTSRQAAIRKFCKVGVPIQLIREPKNKFDKNAIGVWVHGKTLLFGEHNYQLGYIAADQAATLAPAMDAGDPLPATVKAIFGGTAEKPAFGLAIEITKTEEK